MRAGEEEVRIQVDRFILEHLPSVSHLEALLLLFSHQAEHWTEQRVADRLWICVEDSRAILDDLAANNLIVSSPPRHYWYRSDSERDKLLAALSRAYRQDTVAISRMIHDKASSGE